MVSKDIDELKIELSVTQKKYKELNEEHKVHLNKLENRHDHRISIFEAKKENYNQYKGGRPLALIIVLFVSILITLTVGVSQLDSLGDWKDLSIDLSMKYDDEKSEIVLSMLCCFPFAFLLVYAMASGFVPEFEEWNFTLVPESYLLSKIQK